jgi:hypothetical protein
MKEYVKKINDSTYTVTSFTAMHGLKIAQKLTKIISAIEVRDQGINFSSAVDKLIDLDSDLFLTLELLSQALADGVVIQRENFNKIFDDKLGELLELLIFIVEVNFKDFFYTAQAQGNKITQAQVAA